ncbi:hypothetical protein ACSBR1_043147 [Camellia fascicularis]
MGPLNYLINFKNVLLIFLKFLDHFLIPQEIFLTQSHQFLYLYEVSFVMQTRKATRLVAPAIVAGLGALTRTLGTLVPVIGASGFATAAATKLLWELLSAVLDNLLIIVDMFRKLDMHSFGWFILFVQFET